MSYKNILKTQMQVSSSNLDIAKLINKIIIKSVRKLYTIQLDINSNYVDIPKNKKFGLFSTNVAFLLAQTLKQSPDEIAQDLIKEIRIHIPLVEGMPALLVSREQAFINFKASYSYLLFILKHLYSAFGIDKVLIQDSWFKSQSVVIEYASPNPNKIMHSGHLRNILIATPLINAYKLLGTRVYTDMVLNDKGIAISKAMVGYLYFGRKGSLFKKPKDLTLEQALDIKQWYLYPNNWATPESSAMLPDYFVDKMYVLGSTLVKENTVAQKIAQGFVEKWEIGDKVVYKLWELIINWGVQGQQRVFKRLGCSFDTIWRESDHYLMGKLLVRRGILKGILSKDKKDKKGAIVANLTDKGLGKFVVLRSDGTSLYSTQDIALTKLKVNRYKANSYIWIVGAEQSMHFAQLFETVRRLGIVKNEKLIHVAYALLLLNGKKGSSRTGDVVYIDTFLDYIESYLKDNFDLPASSRHKLADFIARVAITKVGATKAFNFDIKEAANPKGHTGAFLMYTYVRAGNIIKKNDIQYPTKRWLKQISPVIIITDASLPSDQALTTLDLDLMNTLMYLPFFVKQMVKIKDPSILVSYAFDLADLFNSYYEQIPVLKSVENVKYFRLYLVHAVRIALQTIIYILGGTPIEQM